MEVNGILTAIQTTKRGLSSQMKRLEVVSENIAHVDRYPDEQGDVYLRKTLQVEDPEKTKLRGFGNELSLKLRRGNSAHMSSSKSNNFLNKAGKSDPFEVVEQNSVKMVFEPNHPQADEYGYVRVADVNMVEEMVDLMAASRVYEANVTVLNTAKQIAKKSIEL